MVSISARPTVGDEEDSNRKIRRMLSRYKCGPKLYIKNKIEIITKYISRIKIIQHVPKEEIFLCGIIGYIGKKNDALPVLIDGLRSLEYRGYDSAGIAMYDGEDLQICKSVGQIANLEDKVKGLKGGSIGIGHTRWATHGSPSEINSHPHQSGKITLVHNGIIENYMELKSLLQSEGVDFKSDTDTEVGAAMLDYLYYKCGNLLDAIKEFKRRVKGSYAMAIILEGMYDRIFVMKNLSPLIIGLGENENYVASDVPAILHKTKNYVILEDGDFAEITATDISLYSFDGKEKELDVKTFSGDVSEADKGEFEHFMLKEIYDEPEIVKILIKKYVSDKGYSSLPDLKKFNSITIVACGSAYHAGLVGKFLIEKNLNIPVEVELASEFKYKRLFVGKKDAVIAISQSGETADTLAAVKISKSLGAHTIGIVNVKESSIAREVDEVIYTLAGTEIAVATTKAYLAQAIVLFLIAMKNEFENDDMKELISAPVFIEKLINERSMFKEIAHELYVHDDVFFIGRLIDYAICLEGSLKLKEISYIHSEAYAAGELKHGTISLISEGTPVISVITDSDIAEKTISNIKEVKARGAHVILIISEECNIVGDFYDKKVVIPKELDGLEAIMCAIPLQLIAYEVAKLRGCSIDKPRNLAKSVTVE